LPDEPSWSVADGPAPGELGPLETRADSCPADCDGPATATSGPGPDESIHSQAAGAVATTSNKASASINRMGHRPLSGGRLDGRASCLGVRLSRRRPVRVGSGDAVS
jgi:hypothetical protein